MSPPLPESCPPSAPGMATSHRLDQHHCGQLPARQYVVADGHLMRDETRARTFINALIASPQRGSSPACGQTRQPEPASVDSPEDQGAPQARHRELSRRGLASSMEAASGPALRTMPGPAAERRVIHDAMRPLPMISDVVQTKAQTRRAPWREQARPRRGGPERVRETD